MEHERRRDQRNVAVLAGIFILFAAGVYLPDLGRGFIKDDFRWVLDGVDAVRHPLHTFIGGWNGNFYRPVVALSFGIDHLFYGLSARGYGFTNFALYLACTLAVYAVLRQTSLPPFAAACGAFAWATNPTGLDMAVLWLSGRTALLMTLFGCASVVSMLRRHRVLGTLLYLAALFSREDALAVPLIVAACAWLGERDRRETFKDLLACAAATMVYFVLRLNTDAITPSTAPVFYQLTWQPRMIAVNALHYVDRAFTSTVVLSLLAAAAYRRVPRFTTMDRRAVLFAALWFVAGLCITVRVPFRSSLYVVFPSVAAALLFGQLVNRLREARDAQVRDRYLIGALAVVLLLIPVYNLRNDRWVEPARVSARAFDALTRDDASDGVTSVVFRDEPVPFSNFAGAFTGVETPALRMMTGRDLRGAVVSQDAPPAVDGSAITTLTLRLEQGQVLVERAGQRVQLSK